jgi:hypothetical protein
LKGCYFELENGRRRIVGGRRMGEVLYVRDVDMCVDGEKHLDLPPS